MRASLLLAIMSLSAATGSIKYGGGTGEPNTPYLIYSPEQMNAIGAEPNDWSKCFKLMADIDLTQYTGTEFHIIGNTDTPFTGIFDGNHRKIAHFCHAGEDQNNVGLFGRALLYGTKINDMCMVEPNVSVVNGRSVGSIVGYLDGGG